MTIANDADIWQYFHRVSVCGKYILEIEGKALNSSLFSIFDKRNHTEFIQSLNVVMQQLEKITQDIENYSDNSGKFSGLKNLISQMKNLALALRIVCTGLYEKTQGRPYPHSKYKSDLNKIDVCKDNCAAAQSILFS